MRAGQAGDSDRCGASRQAVVLADGMKQSNTTQCSRRVARGREDVGRSGRAKTRVRGSRPGKEIFQLCVKLARLETSAPRSPLAGRGSPFFAWLWWVGPWGAVGLKTLVSGDSCIGVEQNGFPSRFAQADSWHPFIPQPKPPGRLHSRTSRQGQGLNGPI
jgi:hypothetical protein